MNAAIETAIVALYDEYVAKHAEGVKLAEAKAAIRDEVRNLVAGVERDVDVETDVTITAVLGATRGKRSRSLKRDLDYLLDGFGEEGAYVDPLLDQAYRLGDETGMDKALRNWTPDDLADLVVTRYRVAADATAAASELDRTVLRVASRMRAASAPTLGDVDWTEA